MVDKTFVAVVADALVAQMIRARAFADVQREGQGGSRCSEDIEEAREDLAEI